MKESLQIWGKIFTSPSEGYQRITPRTKFAFPLLVVLILATLAGAIMLPVITSQAFRDASLRAGMAMLERQVGTLSNNDREVIQTQMDSPLNRNITLVSTLLGSPVSFMIMILLGALVLMIMGKIMKMRVTWGMSLRLFIFTAPVLIVQMLARGSVLLFSDYATRLNAVSTMREFTLAQTASLSAATFIPATSLPYWLYAAIDYVTDIFHIIFFVLLFIGVRALTQESSTGRVMAPVVVTAGLGLLFTVGSTLLTSLFM